MHSMRILSKYFDCINNGTKKIEVRLNDEKRQQIKIGDEITFKDLDNEERQLIAKVTNVYYENTFNDLLSRFDVSIFGDKDSTKEELIEILNKIYSKEEQDKYGVVGIEIRKND